MQLLLTEGNKRVLGGSQLVRRQLDRPATLIMSSMDFAPQAQGKEIGTRLGGKRRDSGYQLNVFEINTLDGKSRLLDNGSGTPFTVEWLADAKGAAVARSEWNAEFGRFSVLARDGNGWKRILEVENGGDSWVAGLIDNDTAVAVVTHNGSERSGLWSLPLDGSPAKKLIDDPQLDIEGVLRDPFDGRPLGVRFSGADRAYRWLDPAIEKRNASLSRAVRRQSGAHRQPFGGQQTGHRPRRKRLGSHYLLPGGLHDQEGRHRRRRISSVAGRRAGHGAQIRLHRAR